MMEYERRSGTDPETILEIRDATVSFDRGKSRVLDGVSLDIRRNEVLGVVGESGSGKSMLANAMLDAVVDPGQLSGSITYSAPGAEPVDVLGLDEQGLRTYRWEEVSMVFQGAMSSFNPTMEIRGHFEETLEAHGVPLPEGMGRARELLEDLYLDPDRVLDSYPHELSGGMKQRTLIALSLVLEPRVLVMDEPTASRDLLMQRSIISLLNRLKDEYDLTLVFITHDLPLVTHLADRLAVMYAFDTVEVGPTDELLRNASHPYTRMLLKTTPNVDSPFDETSGNGRSDSVIEGESPDPVNMPSGCSFHPRCPLADKLCEGTDPRLESVGTNHEAACHYSADAAEAVPFDLSLEDEPAAGGSSGVTAGAALVTR